MTKNKIAGLVAEAFPHRKDNQSGSYNRGWESGINTAFDPSTGRFDDAALAKTQEEVSELADLLERMEAEGRKYYTDSQELTMDFAEHLAEYDYRRGTVDGHLDDRHYTAIHTVAATTPPMGDSREIGCTQRRCSSDEPFS